MTSVVLKWPKLTVVAHARVVNGLVYNSAQIPLDTSGKIVGETIEEQTVGPILTL